MMHRIDDVGVVYGLVSGFLGLWVNGITVQHSHTDRSSSSPVSYSDTLPKTKNKPKNPKFRINWLNIKSKYLARA